MPTSGFKDLELSCLPADARTVVFHSSGTIGQQRSRHFHSAESLAIYEAALWTWFEASALPPRPQGNWRLMVLTPPITGAPHSSLVYMFETIRRKLGATGSWFAGRPAADEAWDVDPGPVLTALTRAADTRQPVLLLGTAFSFLPLLDRLSEGGTRLELPPGSRVLETGGYKGRTRALPKEDLHALITEWLGIPSHHIIGEYGMSELSSQAYDQLIAEPETLTAGNVERVFLFPPWARIQVVSPETGQQVAEGKTGLLRVFDLANVYSVMAIQTEDLAVRRGDGFALLGRAALAEPRGCSLMAV